MAKKLRNLSSAHVISEIETGLKRLSSGLRLLVREVHRDGTNGASRRRRPVTQALRLQGRYMGLIRTLPAKEKGRVKAIRAKKGVHEAIRAARELKA